MRDTLKTEEFGRCCIAAAAHCISMFAIGAISLYQKVISPLKGQCCRFYPSCSVYAKQAIQRKGICRGGWLAVKRILRCHPFNQGGYDPIE